MRKYTFSGMFCVMFLKCALIFLLVFVSGYAGRVIRGSAARNDEESKIIPTRNSADNAQGDSIVYTEIESDTVPTDSTDSPLVQSSSEEDEESAWETLQRMNAAHGSQDESDSIWSKGKQVVDRLSGKSSQERRKWGETGVLYPIKWLYAKLVNGGFYIIGKPPLYDGVHRIVKSEEPIPQYTPPSPIKKDTNSPLGSGIASVKVQESSAMKKPVTVSVSPATGNQATAVGQSTLLGQAGKSTAAANGRSSTSILKGESKKDSNPHFSDSDTDDDAFSLGSRPKKEVKFTSQPSKIENLGFSDAEDQEIFKRRKPDPKKPKSIEIDNFESLSDLDDENSLKSRKTPILSRPILGLKKEKRQDAVASSAASVDVVEDEFDLGGGSGHKKKNMLTSDTAVEKSSKFNGHTPSSTVSSKKEEIVHVLDHLVESPKEEKQPSPSVATPPKVFVPVKSVDADEFAL